MFVVQLLQHSTGLEHKKLWQPSPFELT